MPGWIKSTPCARWPFVQNPPRPVRLFYSRAGSVAGEAGRLSMMNRRRALAVVVAALVVLALVGAVGISARPAKQDAQFKAAWIYVGPHNDHGWSQAHDKGRLYVQK